MTPKQALALFDEMSRAVNRATEQMGSALAGFGKAWLAANADIPEDQRARALAAKQQRGTGPPPAPGWRRERTTKYQRR